MASRAYVCRSQRTVVNGERLLNWLSHMANQRGIRWNVQPFWERGLLDYLHSCDMKCRLLIKHTFKGWLHPLQRLGQLMGTTFTLTISSSLRKRVVHWSSALAFDAATQRTQPLIVWLWWPSRLVFTGSIGWKQRKKQFLAGYHKGSWQRSRWQCPSTSFSLKEAYICKL